ncbi:MAG: SMI1/KNR4 family protein [Lachnospiraceae bacterium]|nr:SMI1/KNR4 family protein [Lachnospiraceae bacterium]
MNRFLSGDSESVIERLCATMNAIDNEWSKKIKPATKEQIQRLKDLVGFNENGIEIPKVYMDFLEKMGQDDGGLLENEWDGFSEVNIVAIIDYYASVYDDEFDYDPKTLLLFLSHWSEAYLYLDMSKGDNPPVYSYEELFADTLESYLFHMAFKYMYKEEYHISDNWLSFTQQQMDDMIRKKTTFNGTMTERMEYISQIMNSLSFEKAWFSDSVRNYYYKDDIVVLVCTYFSLGILVVGKDEDKVLQVKKHITNLLYA